MFGPFKKDLATPHSTAEIHKHRGKGSRPFVPPPQAAPNNFAKAPPMAPPPMAPPAAPLGPMPTMGNSRVGGI